VQFENLKPTVNVKDAAKVVKQGLFMHTPIVAAAQAYVEADVHVDPNGMKYTVVAQEGVFARVSVSTGEGGYAVILKKVHDIWVVIAEGQDMPGKAAGEKYALPTGWYSLEY
jgi:hypothetical protein